MDQHILTFETVKWTCLGKNLAILEVHKLVPALVVHYEIQLAKPENEWRVRNPWVVRAPLTITQLLDIVN